MERRTFLAMPAAAATLPETPKYRVVSPFQATGRFGMPGLYPGSVVSVKAEKSIDPQTETVDTPTVAEMIRRGMAALTGEAAARDAWRKFFVPADVVGIKVNCSGAPRIRSAPEVVAEIVRNLLATGVNADNIYIYERFPDQLSSVDYGRFLAQKVHIFAAEESRGSIRRSTTRPTLTPR